MSDTVIRVENLGKKYIINHQSERQGTYKSLRESISNQAKSLSKNFFKSFGKEISHPDREDFWALNNVSFEIKQGERVGIIGRNGAGKSTLLKILSQITEPTTGCINIQGRIASLLEVGTGFHPELTGRENIYLNGAILGMSKAEIKHKFDEIVAFAEVEKFLDTPVKRYSSGMYVRLAFAVAAHLEPEILVVDEVLAVGDAQFQKKCLGKMEDISKHDKRTIIFVSHNMDAIQTVCTQGILLENGRVKQQSDIYSIMHSYNHLNIDSSINCVKNLLISKNLLLKSFSYSFYHNELEFSLKISSQQEPCHILSAVILLYTLTGTRLTLIDIGNKEGAKISLNANQTIDFQGRIKDLCLIAGHYKLGFAIQTSHGWIDKYQILDLLIEEELSTDENTTIFKYSSDVKGVIKLKYNCEYSII
ncbi:ABC transporter ATP-binding protein [Fortiea contorta]|uniref:ABC transporter ATP-binding protein n=1 Tax=Fortiea contorta TaxID=1892405 RepID=UPI00034AE53E|nr:ABC transporter ATP-binding protein [Fortiea contorta]